MKNELLSNLVKTEFANVKMLKYYDHTERVVGYIRILSKSHSVDEELMVACGWVHDIGRIVDNTYMGHISSLGEVAIRLLKKSGFSESEIAAIISISATHHPKSEEKLQKIEEQILHDADNLDLVGSLGLLRWFGGGIPEKTLNLLSSAKMFINMYNDSVKTKGAFFYTKTATFLAGCRPIENYEFCKSLISEISGIYERNNFSLSEKTLFATQKDCEDRTIILLAGFRCSGKTFSRRIILEYFDVDFYHTNRVKTGDADANIIGPKEIVKRYGGNGKSYFYFLEDDFRSFFSQTNKTIIVDSIKNKSDIDAIRSFFPKCRIKTIWFHASSSVRLGRYINRDLKNNIRHGDLTEHDKELIELGVWEIMKDADCVINTDTPKESLVHRLSEVMVGLT